MTDIPLEDGRNLCFEEHGDPQGRPLLVLHGTPGSRLQVAPLDVAARAAGVRLITPDRPGFGRSTAGPLDFVGYADDLRQLLDHLGLPTAPVAGVSGGGGYALAAAAALPDRISRLVLVCAMVPGAPKEAFAGRLGVVTLFFRLARWAPWLLGQVMTQMSQRETKPPKGVPAQDLRITTDPVLAPALEAAAIEAMRQGTKAAVTEAANYSKRPAFSLADVKVPSLVLHGTDDGNVPIGVARWVTSQLPDAELVEIAGGGHLFVVEQPEELLSRL